MPTQILIPVKTGENLQLPERRQRKQNPVMYEKIQFMVVRIVAAVLINRIALKGIIARHQWKNETRHFMFQNSNPNGQERKLYPLSRTNGF